MTNPLTISGALTALALLASPAASAFDFSDVTGDWNCVVRSYDGTMYRDVSYSVSETGDASIEGWMEITIGADPSIMHIDYTADLTVKVIDDMLHETISDITVIAADLDFDPIDEMARDDLRLDILSDPDGISYIRYASSKALVFEDETILTACTRGN